MNLRKSCFASSGEGRSRVARLRAFAPYVLIDAARQAAAKNLRRGEESGKPMPQNTRLGALEETPERKAENPNKNLGFWPEFLQKIHYVVYSMFS